MTSRNEYVELAKRYSNYIRSNLPETILSHEALSYIVDASLFLHYNLQTFEGLPAEFNVMLAQKMVERANNEDASKFIAMESRLEQLLTASSNISAFPNEKEVNEEDNLIDEFISRSSFFTTDITILKGLQTSLENLIIAIQAIFIKKSLTEEEKIDTRKSLEPVISLESFPRLLSLPFSEQKVQIKDIILITAGIRLFKNDRIIEEIEELLTKLQDSERKRLKEISETLAESSFPESLEIASIQAFIWQKSLGLQSLFDSTVQNFESLFEQLKNSHSSLTKFSSGSMKASKRVVFPLFKAFGETYIHCLHKREALDKYCEAAKLIIEAYDKISADLKPRNQHTESLDGEEQDENDIRSPYERTPSRLIDIVNSKVAFEGFCACCLAEKEKLEVGDYSVDLLRERNNNELFLFCSKECVNNFLKKSNRVLVNVELLLKKYFWLHFLIKRGWLARLEFYIDSLIPDTEVVFTLTKESGAQTPLHFHDKLIDPNYSWNEWDLRRKAYQLMKIRKMQTTGIQTDNSVFKAHVQTQIWELKDTSTMTGVETGTNPIWPKNYIVGLRSKEMQTRSVGV